MKKICLFLTLALLLLATLAFSAYAAEDVVFVAGGGTGDGKSADAPVGSLADAYALLDAENGGTIVFVGDYPISASFLAPVHTGTVKWTCVYGGTDYRDSGAAIRFKGEYAVRLQGPTEIDGFSVLVDTTKAVYFAANFNPLKIGTDMRTANVDGNATSRIRVFGGPWKKTPAVSHLLLEEGMSSTLEVLSGNYYNISAFSYDAASLSHMGTMYITLGGTANATNVWFSITNSTTASSGTVEMTVKDSAQISGVLYLGNNKSLPLTNGDITVNVKDNALIKEFKYYDDELFPEGVDLTLNITGDGVILPENFLECFDTVTKNGRPYGAPEIYEVVYVASNGTGNGASADAPAATIAAACELLDPEVGGTVVISGKYNFTASEIIPAHKGMLTITSLYDGVDYRATNEAQIYDAGAHVLRLNGPTVIDNLDFVFASGKSPTIAANFNNLKIGQGFATVDANSNTITGMRLVGGPYNNNAVGDPLLESTESCTLEVYGGAFQNIIPFSYECDDIASLSHTGTMYVTVGGNAKVSGLWFGITSTTVARAGTTVCTLQDNATVTGTLYMAGSATLPNNGDVTLNIRDNASVAAFKYYDKETLFKYTTRALNITGDNTTLPENIWDCFDVITKDGSPFEKPVTNYDVVYVADGGNGDGKSADAPVATLAKAYELLGEDGGTVVISGKLSITAHITLPAHSGTVTITSLYDDVDYRVTNNAEFYSSVWHIVNFHGETVVRDLTINLGVSFGFAANYNPITIDEGVVINANYDTDNGGRDENGLYIVGVEFNGTNVEGALYDKDTSITIKSGTVSRVIGFGRYCGARHYTGHSTINLEGSAYVRYLYTGAVADNATATSATLNISQNATVERVHVGGSSSTNNMLGKVVINIDKMSGFCHDTNPTGGKIMEFDTMCIYNNKGGVTLYYDASTVPEGALYLAELALFENILPACERDGETHNYSENYTNPYGGEAMLRKCSTCSHIDFVGQVPEKVGENVVFVTDGGFGDGSHPTFPLGSYDEAMELLKTTGGTIVLIGEVTVSPNYTYKFGSEKPCYQEPAHAEGILVTSLYGGVDYRENGAKLVFNGNINYKASGALTFDGIVFDANGADKNILAARYNKLTVGKDVTMTDNIHLTVVGGYQTFSYTDYVDVEIQDELLRFSNHAVKVDTFDLPDMDYVIMHDDYPTTGYTKNPYLRKAAADAFNTMLKDMVASTDENGESLGLKYPYISSAMQSYEHKHDYISRFWARTWRAHPEWSWDEVYLYVTKSTGIPGYSEHHIGLAVDMWDHTLIDPSTGEKYENANQHFDETPEAAWIEENGAKYGIVLRYRGAKSSYVTGFVQEQWHYRYIGAEHAAALLATDSKLLELYVANVIGLFAKDADVTLLGGRYDKVIGGSNNVGFGLYESDIHLTGENRVTIGENAVVGEITDATSKLAGDANGDGKLTVVDAVRIMKHIVDESVALEESADFNFDGIVDLTDLFKVIHAIVNAK